MPLLSQQYLDECEKLRHEPKGHVIQATEARPPSENPKPLPPPMSSCWLMPMTSSSGLPVLAKATEAESATAEAASKLFQTKPTAQPSAAHVQWWKSLKASECAAGDPTVTFWCTSAGVALDTHNGLAGVAHPGSLFFSSVARTLTTPNGVTHTGVFEVMGAVDDPRDLPAAIDAAGGRDMAGSWYYVAEDWSDAEELPWGGDADSPIIDVTLLWNNLLI
eukprot:TRINITY_DN66575_c9_g1_i1.p1 TRINITY_DN66575_c9_g1~~TRINITY_DN66575_c9_g1_i1.p1  ORF type:complete len:220 (-),score=28.83 TRINITY_DN66575_c9_g1_i1:1316-1975(-)